MKKCIIPIALVLAAAMAMPVFAASGQEGDKQSFINIDVRKPVFYPAGESDLTSPADYVYAFFDSMYYAGSEKGDTAGETYEYAYGLLSDSYKVGYNLDDFIESWEDTANVSLIKLIPSGSEVTDGVVCPKYFYETVNTESKDGKGGLVIYNGFVTLEKYEVGYRIKDITKEAEDLLSIVGEGNVVIENPYYKALTFMGNPEDYKASDSEKYTVLEGDRATVKIAGRAIHLAKLTNNTWKILYWEDNK